MKIFVMTIMCCFSVCGLNAQSLTDANETDLKNTTSVKYQAGLHYDLINPAWQGETDGSVVYEFFSYMCPGCNAFEPHIKQLEGRLTESQSIVRVPVAFYPQWEPHAKAYHALNMLGHLELTHEALFAAIHQYKKPLRTLEDVAAWLHASFAIDQQKFLSTAQSFAVDSQLRKDKKMAQVMGIGRVPTLVVNGRFKPNFKKLETPSMILDVTEFLLNQN